jgi:hypothetical protein
VAGITRVYSRASFHFKDTHAAFRVHGGGTLLLVLVVVLVLD